MRQIQETLTDSVWVIAASDDVVCPLDVRDVEVTRHNGIIKTITVYIWRPDSGYVGHCALALSSGTYISWWPETPCTATNPRSKAVVNTSLNSDIKAEGDRQPNIYRLNTSDKVLNAVELWWAGFKDKAPYQIVSNNCSTVAYYVLEAAFPFLNVLNGEVDVWVPRAIEMVVTDLESGKNLFKKQRIKEIKETTHAEAKTLQFVLKGCLLKAVQLVKLEVNDL